MHLFIILVITVQKLSMFQYFSHILNTQQDIKSKMLQSTYRHVTVTCANAATSCNNCCLVGALSLQLWQVDTVLEYLNDTSWTIHSLVLLALYVQVIQSSFFRRLYNSLKLCTVQIPHFAGTQILEKHFKSLFSRKCQFFKIRFSHYLAKSNKYSMLSHICSAFNVVLDSVQEEQITELDFVMGLNGKRCFVLLMILQFSLLYIKVALIEATNPISLEGEK